MPVIREAIHRHRCTSWTLSLAVSAILRSFIFRFFYEAGSPPLFEVLLFTNALMGVTVTLTWGGGF